MLLGAAVGTLTGLLMAPRTGRETRQYVEKSADAYQNWQRIYQRVCSYRQTASESALRNWDETLERL